MDPPVHHGLAGLGETLVAVRVTGAATRRASTTNGCAATRTATTARDRGRHGGLVQDDGPDYGVTLRVRITASNAYGEVAVGDRAGRTDHGGTPVNTGHRRISGEPVGGYQPSTAIAGQWLDGVDHSVPVASLRPRGDDCSPSTTPPVQPPPDGGGPRHADPAPDHRDERRRRRAPRPTPPPSVTVTAAERLKPADQEDDHRSSPRPANVSAPLPKGKTVVARCGRQGSASCVAQNENTF